MGSARRRRRWAASSSPAWDSEAGRDRRGTAYARAASRCGRPHGALATTGLVAGCAEGTETAGGQPGVPPSNGASKRRKWQLAGTEPKEAKVLPWSALFAHFSLARLPVTLHNVSQV